MSRGSFASEAKTSTRTTRTSSPGTFILHLTLFVLHITTTNASPVSAPETNNKSGKNIGSTSSSASLLIKPSAHDAQLNSLNAYAINYGHLAAENSNNGGQGGDTSHFKPSYKLNELENNFTPIQTHNSGNIMSHAAPLTALAPNLNSITSNNNPQQPTPVLMQYLPHTMPEAGVHYLQLIPTRPLIVPISPYLNGNTSPLATQNTAAQTAQLHPPLAAAMNSGPMEYAARPPPPTLLTSEPVNSNVVQRQQQPQLQPQLHPQQQPQLQPQHQQLQFQQQHNQIPTYIDVSHATASQAFGPFATYTNTIQPYRSSFRINREVKGKSYPGTMSLNMNEYMPGPNEALRPIYVRGRP